MKDAYNYIVAVDGPAGAGKSTVCDEVARKLGILHLDTGAVYRTLALKLITMGIDIESEDKICSVLDDIQIEIKYEDGIQKMLIGSDDATKMIRTNEVSNAASITSKFASVRKKSVELQRSAAKGLSMIVDGRDICTFVFPDAKYKFYLTAGAKERARRRYLQLREQGVESSIEELERQITERDERDSSRKNSPLKIDKDAVIIDTDNLTKEGAVQKMMEHIYEK